MNSLLISFVLYFGLLLGIGILFYRLTKTSKSYFIGNRSLNYWVTAISAQSSDMGAWLFLAYPATVYLSGTPAIWTAVGLVVCMYLNWAYVAPKLRAQTENLRCYTLPSYLAQRTNDTTNLIRPLSACIALYFFTIYVASGLVGLGRLFETAFHLPYLTGIILAVVITLLYTLMGGFLAVSWCNLLQGLFLLAVILFVPFYGYFVVDGWTAIASAAAKKHIPLALTLDLPTLKTIFLFFTSYGIGYFGQPHILVNFMGIDDPRKIRAASIVGITWQILALGGAVMIGLVGIAFFPAGLANSETLFINMVTDLFPPLIAGFALCGMLAATLSTITTQILVAAGGIVQDMLPTVTSLQEKNRLAVSRFLTIGVAVAATVLASTNSTSIYNLVHYAWSGLGATFGPVLLMALYNKNLRPVACLAGMITATVITAVLPIYLPHLPQLLIGFVANSLLLIGTTKFLK